MKVTCATLIETTVYARSVLTMASNYEFRVANLPTTSIDCRQRNRWERSALGVSGTGYERGHDISHRKSPGRPQAIAAGNPRNVSVHARVRGPIPMHPRKCRDAALPYPRRRPREKRLQNPFESHTETYCSLVEARVASATAQKATYWVHRLCSLDGNAVERRLVRLHLQPLRTIEFRSRLGPHKTRSHI